MCAPLGFPPPPPPSPSHQPVPVPSVAGYRRRRLPQIRFSLKPSRLPFPPILHDGWEERGRGKGWHRGVARGASCIGAGCGGGARSSCSGLHLCSCPSSAGMGPAGLGEV
uniref:Predicted protein n=1 Tax=Hordeum vulgare subsp. vulgare TaxID=112509 RepID=F2D883_HORVV|nr:predicted protein [Hordeum vulgare subsp. vulgare]